MYINTQNMYYDYNKQADPYVEVVSLNISSDGTFNNLNDMFEKLSLKVESIIEKEKIFELSKDWAFFGDTESKKLAEYIKSISVEEKENIFDYYD